MKEKNPVSHMVLCHFFVSLLTCVFVTKCSLETIQTLRGFLLVKDLVMFDLLLLISDVVCKPQLQDSRLLDRKLCSVNNTVI